MAVLGVNGAGKSTMLRCLNRVLKPKRATVYIDGQSLAGLSGAALARRMGYVPQERAQCELTVREMVMLGRKPHMKWGPTAKDEQVVDSVIKRMRIQRPGPSPGGQGSAAARPKRWSWPGPWPRNPRSCCWTNPPATWTCATSLN